MSAERAAYKSATQLNTELAAKDRVARLLSELDAQRATISRLGEEVRIWQRRCELYQSTRLLRR